MQLYGSNPGMPTSWVVTTPSGKQITVTDVGTAYVDEKTGTLHLMASHQTLVAFGRGFWASVEPKP